MHSTESTEVHYNLAAMQTQLVLTYKALFLQQGQQVSWDQTDVYQ